MITYIIIGLNVIASFYAWNNQEVYHRWMLNPYQVQKKQQYFRFITSGFIHFDYMHLFFNMLTLYFFGAIVESIFESIYGNIGLFLYVVMYLAGIVVSDIPSYLKHRNDYNYNSLGASGAVSAVMFSFILFYPLNELYLFFAIPIKAVLFAVLYLIYSYYRGKQMGDNINHDAHLVGALFGIVFTIGIYPNVVIIFLRELGIFL
ncbi:MAG TPA: rhomboid family intramembrane serine protease [Cytophagales bacterium]|nr:rhomboid family intramembrane serine protease [Cytophagales bacterium]